MTSLTRCFLFSDEKGWDLNVSDGLSDIQNAWYTGGRAGCHCLMHAGTNIDTDTLQWKLWREPNVQKCGPAIKLLIQLFSEWQLLLLLLPLLSAACPNLRQQLILFSTLSHACHPQVTPLLPRLCLTSWLRPVLMLLCILGCSCSAVSWAFWCFWPLSDLHSQELPVTVKIYEALTVGVEPRAAQGCSLKNNIQGQTNSYTGLQDEYVYIWMPLTGFLWMAAAIRY